MINLKYIKTRLFIPILVVLSPLIAQAVSLLHNQGWLLGLGTTAVVIGFLAIYDKWLWKIRGFKCLNTIPDLNGDYHGDIEYYYEGKDRKLKCVLTIRQTLSHLIATSTFYKEGENDKLSSKSTSTEAIIKTDDLGKHKLILVYINNGSGKNGNTQGQHDGLNILSVDTDEDLIKLEGYYFTNRKPVQTKGIMTVQKTK